MAKSKGNRFEGFEDFKAEPPGRSPGVQGQAKSKNPDFKKVTLYLTKELHLKMRSQTLTTEEDMSELVERIMGEYFEQLDS
ncbi:hypothetical protein [Picosynechococcus sp. PCC 11901]|uniref:hypothetical protein n=1 Tax=Picosynechococcus sp. PCC 11901 TaxID=2579791 RepID=UPI0030DD1278